MEPPVSNTEVTVESEYQVEIPVDETPIQPDNRQEQTKNQL